MNLHDYLACLQPENERLIGATSMEEQAFCGWFAEHCLTQGGVVELGPWLGSLTIPTLRGINRNASLAPSQRVIATYDLFHWHQWCETWVAGTPFEGRCKPGDSFLPLYEEIVAPHTKDAVLQIHQEDLERTRWSREPIEFLINDAWKTVLLMSNTIHEFFPSLVPNAVVFHQDYLWSRNPSSILACITLGTASSLSAGFHARLPLFSVKSGRSPPRQ